MQRLIIGTSSRLFLTGIIRLLAIFRSAKSLFQATARLKLMDFFLDLLLTKLLKAY